MKKLLVWLVTATFLCLIVDFLCGATDMDPTTEEETLQAPQNLNKLNWVEVAHKSFSTQIMFDFSQPIYFKKKITKDSLQLSLSFPGMQLQNFNKQHVIVQLEKLKQEGLIEKIEIFEKNKGISKVKLIIQFAKQRKIKDSEEKAQNNHLLIIWNKMEDPNRLILDIFTKEDLNTLEKNDSIIFQAQNQNANMDTEVELKPEITITAQSDGLPQPMATTFQSKQVIPRILIDAGHGGPDEGAVGYGMKEKDLTLDLAKQVSSKLKSSGCNVLLTRNTDRELTLIERSELALQLKANLFVSIHVNSSGKLNTTPSGVETFYLNPQPFLSESRRGGFLFVNLEKDMELAQRANQYLKRNATSSKQLAAHIQSALVSTIKKEGCEITDRGIKPGLFRVLIQNSVPAALVEVGFVTNKHEALKLSKSNYRQILAQGICDGIQKYICTTN
jgi:N-acetylmuramoyl-L-alanine amidase